jgi:hypothetical protein
MFEARQVCEVYAIAHHINGAAERINLKMNNLPPRAICDPIIYYDRAQNLCRSRESANIRDIDFVMRARRTTESDMVTIIKSSGFCEKRYEYKLLRNNAWFTYNENSPAVATR